MTRPRGDNGGNGGRGGGNRGSGGRNKRRRGRGRGRGRGNARQPAYQSQRKTSQEENIISWKDSSEPRETKFRNLMLKKSTFQNHFDAQNEDAHYYLACIIVLLRNNIQIGDNAKALALAALWARKDFMKSEFLLQKIPEEVFALKEVLKACTILDAARNKRAHEKVLKRLESQGCKKRKKLIKYRTTIGALQAEIVPVGSLSGALIKHVKSWVRTIPADRLHFFAMHFPKDLWKKLADLCHLHPEKDFPQCPWFLPFCFGKAMPENVSVPAGPDITAENICEMIMSADIDYSVARKFASSLNVPAKERISRYTKLDTVLWYYEELKCGEVNKVLYERLKGGEKPTLSYGKLMERVLYFTNLRREGNRSQVMLDDWAVYDSDSEAQPNIPPQEEAKLAFVKYLIREADMQLRQIRFNLATPVSVIGDNSSSMDVAIKTSNIIASLVTAVSNADLVFFNSYNEIPSFIPKDVKGVLKLNEEIKAKGCTCPAASLYPYYKDKKVFKTFVVVTDEGENTSYGDSRENVNYRFADLFKKYHDEIYPARLVFISFLSQTDPGSMVSEFKNRYPELNVLQFRFSGDRPDLSKLDNIFGLLSSESESFVGEMEEVLRVVQRDDILAMTELLTL